MTRFASIMGVATVATLVLLSGCETAVRTDYTKKLDGTWTAMTQVMHELGPIDTEVSVKVVDNPGASVNTGTFTLTVTQPSPTDGTPVDTVGSGTVKAESASVLKVTLTEVMGPGATSDIEELTGIEQTFNYVLMDDLLQVSSPILNELGVTSSATAKLDLTRQASK